MMCSPKISVFTGMTHKNVMLNPQLNQLYPVSLCPADALWDTISLEKGETPIPFPFVKGGGEGLFLFQKAKFIRLIDLGILTSEI